MLMELSLLQQVKIALLNCGELNTRATFLFSISASTRMNLVPLPCIVAAKSSKLRFNLSNTNWLNDILHGQ